MSTSSLVIRDETREAFSVLLKATQITHGRYDWSGTEFFVRRLSGLWDGLSEDERKRHNFVRQLAEDKSKVFAVRTYGANYQLKRAGEVEPDFENLAFCVQAARIIFGRYEWGNRMFHFAGELEGDVEEITEKLELDFEELYRLRKDKQFLRGNGPNDRVLATLEGLMFQAISSVKPFSRTRNNDQGRYTRVLRCVEGLLFQLASTVDSEFAKQIW
jgi:hypothetical protein